MIARSFSICLFILVIHTSNLHSQVSGGSNEKLRELYNLGKYEDCLFKAERLTQGEKTGKDPEPFLYVSMCFFEISKKDPTELEGSEFKNPLGEALKSALKYKMKDRKNELLAQNMPFFTSLKAAHVHLAANAINAGDYRKPVTIFSSLLKLVDDTCLVYSKGVCEVLTKVSAGAKAIDASLKYFSRKIQSDSAFYKTLDEGSQEALTEGGLLHVNYLSDNNQEDSAKNVVAILYQALPTSKLIRNKYNKLWNIKEGDRPEFKNGAKIKYKSTQSETDLPIVQPVDSLNIPKEN